MKRHDIILSLWCYGVGSIIANYATLTIEDKLGLLFHGKKGFFETHAITVIWQNMKPNGKTWYCYKFNGRQSKPLRIEDMFQPNAFDCCKICNSWFKDWYVCYHEPLHWLKRILTNIQITSKIYSAYLCELQIQLTMID